MADTRHRGLLPELADWLRSTGADTAHTPAPDAPWSDPLGAAPLLVTLTGDADVDSDAGGAEDTDDAGATGPALAALTGVRTTRCDLAGASVDDARVRGGEIADRAADDGIPLLLLGLPDVPATTGAAVIGTLCNLEPVKALSPAGRTDRAWADEVTAVRDLMFTTRSLRRGPSGESKTTAVLATVGSPVLAAATGLLLRSTERRTPVILDGTASLAAALLAGASAPGASQWWLAPHRPAGAASDAALDQLQLRPVHDRDLGATGGGAGVCVLPLLRAAALSTTR